MSKELLNYINDPNSPLTNLFLGEWYEKQGHFVPASSFYLRCAELAAEQKNDELRYEGILKTYVCYRSLNNRDYTLENLLKQAISFAYDRPEAYYFLSKFYENKDNMLDAYLYASIASNLTKPSRFRTKIDFPGIYGPILQKAICSWWVGKPNDARRLYQYLIDNYRSDMTETDKNILQNNTMALGFKAPDEYTRQYKQIFHDRLKFKFKHSESIKENYSQAYQDMMVLFLTNGKSQGTYVEIGSSKPFESNNTVLLEKDPFNWKGIGVEIDKTKVLDYKKHRKNLIIEADATQLDYNKIFEENFESTNIDYLQLDVEPAKNTFRVLFELPFDKYKFGIITYEHDYSADITRSYREKSRKFLKLMGYELLVNDIGNTKDSCFEDWWYHPDIIDPKRAEIIKSVDFQKMHYINDFMLD
jgi:hypothetical protein